MKRSLTYRKTSKKNADSTMINYYYYIKSICCLILICFGCVSAFSVEIGVDTVWQGDTVFVEEDILINNGAKLIIRPGTTVFFKGYYSLVVKGAIEATGTKDNQIIFTVFDKTGYTNYGTDEGSWKGIRFSKDNDNQASILSYCIIEYTKAPGEPYQGSGGGISVDEYEDLEITNCILRNNYARIGGGIFFNNTEANLFNSSIYDNIASQAGGGIFCVNSEIDIVNNIIAYNTSIDGGGLFLQSSIEPLLYNNTICHNIANNIGGGMYLHSGSSPTIVNTIFYYNQSTIASGQLYISPNSHPNIYNSNIQNGEDNIFAIPEQEFFGELKNNIDSLPEFVDSFHLDFKLFEGSPCIDKGDNEYVVTEVDIINNLRLWDGNDDDSLVIDQGAYEYNSPSALLVNYSIKDVSIGGIQNGELYVTISGGVAPYKIYLVGLNNTVKLTDLSSGSYTITGLGIGSYSLQVYDENNHTYFATVYISFSGEVDFSISGTVHAGNDLVENGMVIAFIREEEYYLPQKLSLIYNGEYVIENTDSSDYLLCAIPNPSLYKNYTPGYYAESNYWQTADPVHVFGNTYDVDINLLEITNPSAGEGLIEGHIILEDTSIYEKNIYRKSWFVSDTSQNFDSGYYAKNIPVILYNASGIPVLWTLSDKAGNFRISGLPEGEYTIFVHKPGLKQINNPTINISYENTDTIEVFALLRSEDIVINLGNNQKVIEITAVPNPVKEKLNIGFAFYPQLDFELILFNLKGQIMFKDNLTKITGDTNFEFDMSSYMYGIYTMQINTLTEHKVIKIIKL